MKDKVKKEMSGRDVAKGIREFNKWRRGEGKYGKAGAMLGIEPKELGVMLDFAADHLEKRMDVVEFRALVSLADERYQEYRRASKMKRGKVPPKYTHAMRAAYGVVRMLDKAKVKGKGK